MGNRESTLPMDAPNAEETTTGEQMKEILPARKKGITWSKLSRCCMDDDDESNGQSSEPVVAETDETAPLLHKHHKEKSISNQSSSNNNEEKYDDIADLEIARSTEMSIGACRSIEEASVNTTIESGTINETETSVNIRTDTSDALPPSHHHNVELRLTPEEQRLFDILTNAAEAYESNQLSIDPNPTENSVSARGGFTKQETPDDDEDGRKSWLKPPPKVERIEIRVAGGWVRDKLLNQHSCDVDVALDCMMGVQFARIVQSYLAVEQERKDKEEEKKKKKIESGDDNGEVVMKKVEAEAEEQQQQSTKKGKKDSKQSKKQQQKKKKGEKTTKQPKIGVIGANPSQSKHLETATMNIHGIDVDFVNLRAEEVYESNSRIPTSKTRMFGSPLEDALRRDFTINSLFYNVRTHRVEDWTGRGLDDLLSHRKVVTPVDPHVTFHDDPLRVLRAIRFCVRLDFTLDDAIKEAAMAKRVHHSLHVKVSRERVGKELEGMLTGKHARPARALDMIAGLHLAGSVFAFPGTFPGDHYAGGPVSGHILGADYCCSVGTDSKHTIDLAAKQRAVGWGESSNLLKVLPAVVEAHEGERTNILSDSKAASQEGDPLPTTADMRLLHLCTFILPFHNLTFPDKKGRQVSVTAHMIKEALKFSVKDIQTVSMILSHVDEMSTILGEIRSQLTEAQKGAEGSVSLSQITPLCRLRAGLLLRSLKEHWVTCLLTAAAWEIRTHQRTLDNEASPEEVATATHEIPLEQPSQELYHAITSGVHLDECWRVPPHLNGKEMIKELSIPNGPTVGVYLEIQTKWMLLNPEGTREECMVHLRECKKEREQAGVVDEVNRSAANANGAKQSTKKKKNKKKGNAGDAASGHVSKKIRAEN